VMGGKKKRKKVVMSLFLLLKDTDIEVKNFSFLLDSVGKTSQMNEC
jgi:hypothetical protein